jgi:hypothetical protein
MSGVNHLKCIFLSFLTKKAVSGTAFSFAIFNKIESSNHFSSGTTQAGFPLKRVSVKAST